MRPEPLTRAPSPTPYDAWRHRYTVFVAGAVIVLLMAGGLVTSTGSGLAVPDWPLSFGKVFPPMVGGVLYEHGHRMVATAVGLLTVLLGVWYGIREPRPWARRLALLAIVGVVIQGLLGGVTVLLRLPLVVSVSHACVAQAFFGLIVFLAAATSRPFVAGEVRSLPRDGTPPLWCLGALATGLIYAQVILGAIVRHTGAGLAIRDFPLAFGRLVPPFQSAAVILHFAHRVVALLALGAVVWMAGRAWRAGRGRAELIRPATTAVILVVLQIALGAATVLTRLAVLPATLHLVNGALLLAACGILSLRAWRAARGGASLRARRGAVPGLLRRSAADYLELSKPRVTFMVLATTAAGFYLGAGGTLDGRRLLLTLLGTLLVAAGTSALNQYVEREADGRMERTRARPLPAGRMTPAQALLFATSISAVGMAVLGAAVNLQSAVLAGLTLVLYIFVYTPLKKTTPLSTLVGAVPGALPPLIGWVAARGGITPGGLALFAILFVWQLPHSLAIAWMYREDYARGGFRLLSVTHPHGGATARQILLHALVLLPVSLLPAVLGMAGPAYFAGAVLLGLILTGVAVPVVFDATTRSARRVLLTSVVYLPALLGLLIIDRTTTLWP